MIPIEKTPEPNPVEAWRARNPAFQDIKISRLEITIKPAQYNEKGEEIVPEKTAVGYFQEANRFVVGQVLGLQTRDQIQGAKCWIDACLIQEISDPIFLQADKDILLTCVKYSQSIAEVKKSSMTTI